MNVVKRKSQRIFINNRKIILLVFTLLGIGLLIFLQSSNITRKILPYTDILSSGTISAIAAIMGLLGLWYQLKKQRDLSEAQFILDLNNSFADNPNIRDIYSILDRNINSPEDPFSEEDDLKIAEYLSFFGPFCNLIERKILCYKIIDGFISYRFFLALNNSYVQKRMLIKDAEYFGIIFALYDGWVKYRKKTGQKEPFEKTALSKNFPNYKKYMKQIV